MSLSFATCERIRAEKFLEDKGYDYLTPAAKTYILENLSLDFRVQDPMMHPRPCVIMSGPSAKLHNDVLVSLTDPKDVRTVVDVPSSNPDPGPDDAAQADGPADLDEGVQG